MDPASPRRGELIWIALFAIALRVGVYVAATVHAHLTLADFNLRGDTTSYTAWAAAIDGERPLSSINDYDRRVFPGYPVLIALVHFTRIPLPLCAGIVTWISAGLVASMSAKVFNDARVGWAMTCLVPHYLINSSLGMSEAPMLLFALAGLLASRGNRPILAGALLGFAGTIRPVACFAAAGVLFALLRERRARVAVVTGLTALSVVAAAFGALQAWTGDALLGPRVYANHPGAYHGRMIVWPMFSLLTVPSTDPAITRWRIVYIWLHVAGVMTASALLLVRMLRDRRPLPRDAVAWPWVTGNLAFTLVIGPPWGFLHFPRFSIPAQPAQFWALREWLPRRPIWYALIAAIIFIPAVVGVIQAT